MSDEAQEPRPVPRRRLRPVQALLAFVLAALILSVDALILSNAKELASSDEQFRMAGYSTTNMANLQREVLLAKGEVPDEVEAGDFQSTAVHVGLIRNQLRMLKVSHGRDDAARELKELESAVGRIEPLIAEIRAGRRSVQESMPELERLLGGMEAAVKRMYDREELEFNTNLRELLKGRYEAERLLVLLSGLVLVVAAALVFSLRRRVRKDFDRAYEAVLVEVEERRSAEAELLSERNRSEAILDSIAEGVVITDLAGNVRSINPAMARLAGCASEDILGRHIADALHFFDEDGRAVVNGNLAVSEAIRSRTHVSSRGFGHTIEVADGRRVPVSISASPVVGHDGELLAGVAFVRDVSYEYEIDRMKSSIVSTVSHEFRTPLTMIQGFSELLLARDAGAAQRTEALTQINTAAQRLSRLVEALLSASKIEAGAMDLSRSEIDLGSVLGAAAAQFSRVRPIDLEMDAPITIWADGDLIHQVVTNLLSNAVKYSPEDSKVTVRAQARAGNVEITIDDRGIGLSASDLEHAFDKFFRAERAEVRRQSGTGLGLFITKRLVELHGGTIGMSSMPGLGTTVAFTIPITPSPIPTGG